MLNFFLTLCVAIPIGLGVAFLIDKAYKYFGVLQDIDTAPVTSHLKGGETRITRCKEGFTAEVFEPEQGGWRYLPHMFNAKMESAKWMTPKPTPQFFPTEGLAAQTLGIYLRYHYGEECAAWNKLKP